MDKNWYRELMDKMDQVETLDADEGQSLFSRTDAGLPLLEGEEEGYKQQDGTIIPYKTWHPVSEFIAIMPLKTTYRIKLIPTGEVVTPAGQAGRDALMMALYKNEVPDGYAQFCFGTDYSDLLDKSSEVTEEDEELPVEAPARKTKEDIQDFCGAVEAKIAAHYAKSFPTLQAPKIEFKLGPKFAKIIISNHGGTQRSVFCFIDMATGNILKAASWAAPAKGIRGNIKNGAADVTEYGAKYYR